MPRLYAQHHMQRLNPQPLAVTHGAFGAAHVILHAFLDPLALAVLKAPAKIGNHALKTESVGGFVRFRGAVHQHPTDVLRDLVIGAVLLDVHALAERSQHPAVQIIHPPAVFSPRLDRTVADRERLIRDDQVFIEFIDDAQAGALRTRAIGRVE